MPQTMRGCLARIMAKPAIREVIVVEGRHDTERLREFFDCETIETGGTSLGEEKLEEIRAAQQRCGVIILTDPDSPGNRIRNAVSRAVPGCLHAFVANEDAHTAHKVGVEHANEETLRAALAHLITLKEKQEKLTPADLYEMGLLGRASSADLRACLGRRLHIGAGTAKTMCRRLNGLGFTREQLRKEIENAETDCEHGQDQGDPESL